MAIKLNQVSGITIGFITAVSVLSACERDYKRPQLSDPAQNSELASKKDGMYPSVGNIGSDKKSASETQKQLTDQQTVQSKTVLPKDANGEVGSTMASNIRPSNLNSAANTQIDVSRYPFEKKDEFKTFMQSRIQAVDQGLKGLKGQSSSAAVTTKSVDELQQRENEIASRLNKVDSVDPKSWNQFKTSFRDDVVGLERSYQMLSTARR